MYSVTQRINNITQPKGGYVPISYFEKETFSDGIALSEENISASIIGMAVDYLCRMKLFNLASKDAFAISIIGMKKLYNVTLDDEIVNYGVKLLNDIDGDDLKKSIHSSCQMVGFDVCYRAGCSFYKPVEEINPDKLTIGNIAIMINRTEEFFDYYGKPTNQGMTFLGGYTKIISAGDADIMTEDTLFDFKVSKTGINNKQTLQLLVYYLLGIHSNNKEEFKKIKYLAIYNPRLNVLYKCEIKKIPKEIIEKVETEVIGY